jgi:predicted solute-binding protein
VAYAKSQVKITTTDVLTAWRDLSHTPAIPIFARIAVAAAKTADRRPREPSHRSKNIMARIATELNQISTMIQRRRKKARTEAVIFVPVLTAALILVWQLVKAGHRQALNCVRNRSM